MLDKRRATEFVDQLDLDGLQPCTMCLFDLAWEMRTAGEAKTGLVQQTAGNVWPEIEIALGLAVIDARMREVPGAEQALADLEAKGWRTPLVRAVVTQLAQGLVDEMAGREAGSCCECVSDKTGARVCPVRSRAEAEPCSVGAGSSSSGSPAGSGRSCCGGCGSAARDAPRGRAATSRATSFSSSA